jgi:SAM-dependent methyltransferase
VEENKRDGAGDDQEGEGEMKLNLDALRRFYEQQNAWVGAYSGEVTERHRENAAVVYRLAGGRLGRLLELGAGGGQDAAAAADLGYWVVAVDIVPSFVDGARKLVSGVRKGRLHAVQADFYEVEFPRPFDIVCYWDGFGIGADEDQRRLLKRIADWLLPDGFALIEVYTPQYWARAAGRRMEFGRAVRQYDFDTQACRMLDRWWPVGHEDSAISQSLRCYAPDDLRALLEGTGLTLKHLESRGAYDFERNRFDEDAAVDDSMQYLAMLALSTA